MNNYLLAHASNGGEALSESLTFTSPAIASYARRRSHRNMPPLGGSDYGLQGSGRTTTIRLRVSGDEFLDPSTLALKFTVINANRNNPLVHVAPMYCYFKRFRVLINGYVVEEIDDFHRTCAMIDACSSRDAVYAQRMKQGWFLDQVGQDLNQAAINENSETFVVPFRASGLFNNLGNKWLPLKYLPQIDIELETCVIDDCLYCLNPTNNGTATNAVSASDITITNVRLMYDTVMLDSGIEDQFYKHLESGGTLDIPFATWRNTRQVMTANNFSVLVSANVKSARSLFFSVIKNNTTTGELDTGVVTSIAALGLPAGLQATSGAAGQFYQHGLTNVEVQVGNQIIPDNPITSTAEFYHYLSVAWNKHHTYSDPLGITWQEYVNDRSGPYTASMGLSNVTADLALTDLGPYPLPSHLCTDAGAPLLTGTAVNGAASVDVDVYRAVRNYGSRFIVGLNLERFLDLFASGVDLSNEIINIRGTCKGEAATASIMLHYNCILQIGRGVINVLERA